VKSVKSKVHEVVILNPFENKVYEVMKFALIDTAHEAAETMNMYSYYFVILCCNVHWSPIVE
jgi:hypothetical protein